MIIKIDRSPRIRKTLNYNFDKMKEYDQDGNAVCEIIDSTVFLGSEEIVEKEFNLIGFLNQNRQLINRFCHIKVAISPEDNIPTKEFLKIGREVISGLGFDRLSTPYISFSHRDTKHDHIHIAISRTDTKGNTNPLNHDGFKSKSLSREIEERHGLVNAYAKRLDKNGVRLPKYYETKAEKEKGFQTTVRQVRDTISKAIGSSASFQEFMMDIARNNIKVKFRIQEGEDKKLTVGLSYRINTLSPPVYTSKPSLSLDWKLDNPLKVLKEIKEKDYSVEGDNKYYIDAANQVRTNNNLYPVVPTDSWSIRASDIGPGSQWFSLKDKYNLSTEMFRDLLVEEDLDQSVKKGNVWQLYSEEFFPSENELEQKAMVGIQSNTPQFILEASEGGVNFLELFKKKLTSINAGEARDRLAFLAGLDKNLTPAEILLSFPEIKEKYDKAIESDLSISKDDALSYSIGLINDNVIEITEQMEIIEQKRGLELESTPESIHSSKEESKELEKNILQWYLKSNSEALNKALQNQDVSFLALRNQMDYDIIKKLKLEDSLLSSLEFRIAQEIYNDPSKASSLTNGIDSMAIRNDAELRFLVKTNFVDFTKIKDIESDFRDPRIAEEITYRLNNDYQFVPERVKLAQDKLDLANILRKGEQVFEYLKMPLLDFSKTIVDNFSDLTPAQIGQLEQRVEQDSERSADLQLYREGNAIINSSTGKIENANYVYSKPEISQKDVFDNPLNQDKNKEKGM